MKAKRVVGVLAALLLCICMIMPVNTDAAAQVRVRTVKGVTSSYTGRKSYCYVNGQKRKLTKYPIFKKSGAYMGPVGAILKNSKLKVKATAKGDKFNLWSKHSYCTGRQQNSSNEWTEKYNGGTSSSWNIHSYR